MRVMEKWMDKVTKSGDEVDLYNHHFLIKSAKKGMSLH